MWCAAIGRENELWVEGADVPFHHPHEAWVLFVGVSSMPAKFPDGTPPTCGVPSGCRINSGWVA